MKYRLLFPITLFLSACLTEEPTQLKDPLEQAIDSIVIAHQQAFEVPGIAVGLIKDNEVVYAKGFGVQATDTQQPLTVQSLFHMASVSKPFVATAIMQLVEAGKVDLDRKLVEYLPYFTMGDDRYKTITIRQMLNHSSGIPDVEDYEWDQPQYDEGAAERYARSFATSPLDFEPSTDFSYSNAAFDILANVIAQASQMTFEAYMQQYIFEPLGMNNSTFYKPDVPTELATKPHVMNSQLKVAVAAVYPYNRRHAPSSTLHSNVEDMFQWALVNLNRGALNGTRIYSENSYKQLSTGQLTTNGKDSVCLSWFASQIGNFRMLSHSGGDEGYRTYFGFVPEKKTAVVLMGNSDFFQSSSAAHQILDKVLLHSPVEPVKKPIHFELRKYILTEGIEKCKAVYFEKKEKHPDQYIFRGGLLDNLGYALLDRGHQQEALDIFLFNVELAPEESGFYDSVADAYRAMGKKDLAIEWYEKALAINPEQGFSIRKLTELRMEE